jgi:hypothetical protein
MTPNVEHFLAKKETRRNKRILKRKTVETKKLCRKQKHEKQRRDETTAMMEREKRDGTTYKTAQHMEDVLGDDEPGIPGIARKKALNNKCPYCGKKGHKTTRSTHCLQNPAYLARTAALAAPTTNAATATIAAADAVNYPDSEIKEIDDLYCRPLRDNPLTDEDRDSGITDSGILRGVI